jgi:hypothetical protein
MQTEKQIGQSKREDSKREKNVTQERVFRRKCRGMQPAERGSHAGCSIQRKMSMKLYRQPKDASATGKLSKKGFESQTACGI